MKSIVLSNGSKAIVDDEDYEYISQWKWGCAQGYASRTKRSEPCSHGYRKILTVRMHRLIMNAPDDKDVDHINRDKLDNRKSNLRICTHQENSRNQTRRSHNKSGYIGVHWDKRVKKWEASVRVDGRRLLIGHFLDVITAAKARDEAVIKYYNGFGVLNFPELNKQ